MYRQYKSFDERSLLLLIKQNDEERAFKEIFYRYQENVYRYALKIVRRSEIAEEILQDIFVKVWNYRKQIDEDRPFSALLFRIAKNTLLNALKLQKIQARLTDDAIDNLIAHISPEDGIIWQQYIEILDQALTTLPERCRDIFQKSRFEGLSYDEIAQELGISKNTVRLQIIKSLKLLREFLTAHPEFDAAVPLLYILIIR